MNKLDKMPNQCILKLENISKSYRIADKEIRVLKGINLEIDKGEFVVIRGPSGSGKTTFLNLLAGLDIPDAGRIYLGGKNIASLKDDALSRLRNQEIGFIFQLHYLLAEFTALENVIIPALIRNSGQKERKALREIKREAKNGLENLGLKERIEHFPGQLSSGEQQRVGIARALINRPLLLLADEPTGDLDKKNKEIILQILSSLHKEGQTIIMATHEKLDDLIFSRSLYLEEGQLKEKTGGKE